MNLNWLLRFKNKYTLTCLVTGTITFIYLVLGCFDIVPSISQDQVTQYAAIIIDILVTFGVVIDPTTKGASDSDRALNYTEPQ